MAGSTTKSEGADHEDLCIRPRGTQVWHCNAGQVCSLNLLGFSLQDGHQLAVDASGSCAGALLEVPGIAQSGISKPATQQGTLYTWGDVAVDFLPEPSVFALCWCANMNGLACDSLEAFQILAGQLQVGNYAKCLPLLPYTFLDF